jgi:hypothetical protein
VTNPWVQICIPTKLASKDKSYMMICVESGVGSATGANLLSNMFNGGAACRCTHRSPSRKGSREIARTYGMGKCAEDSMSALEIHRVEVGVVSETAFTEELEPPLPGAFLRGKGRPRNSVRTGASRARAHSLEIRISGSDDIVKRSVTCERQCERICWVRRASERDWWRERISAT